MLKQFAFRITGNCKFIDLGGYTNLFSHLSEQHSMRQGLDDHEAWLDTLDKKLFVSNSEVKVEFDNPICFPLDECTDLKDLKGMARTLRSILSCNETPLPRKYLIERFLRLVIRENRLPTTVEKAVRELRMDWNISNEYQDW